MRAEIIRLISAGHGRRTTCDVAGVGWARFRRNFRDDAEFRDAVVGAETRLAESVDQLQLNHVFGVPLLDDAGVQRKDRRGRARWKVAPKYRAILDFQRRRDAAARQRREWKLRRDEKDERAAGFDLAAEAAKSIAIAEARKKERGDG